MSLRSTTLEARKQFRFAAAGERTWQPHSSLVLPGAMVFTFTGFDLGVQIPLDIIVFHGVVFLPSGRQTLGFSGIYFGEKHELMLFPESFSWEVLLTETGIVPLIGNLWAYYYLRLDG